MIQVQILAGREASTRFSIKTLLFDNIIPWTDNLIVHLKAHYKHVLCSLAVGVLLIIGVYWLAYMLGRQLRSEFMILGATIVSLVLLLLFVFVVMLRVSLVMGIGALLFIVFVIWTRPLSKEWRRGAASALSEPHFIEVCRQFALAAVLTGGRRELTVSDVPAEIRTTFSQPRSPVSIRELADGSREIVLSNYILHFGPLDTARSRQFEEVCTDVYVALNLRQ